MGKKNTGEWTEIIRSKRGLFEINLQEVWEYRELIFLFVRRDLVSQYKQTILGPLWFFIQPLFTTLIFYFIFNRIAGISTDGVHPIIFYLSGITFWNYFSDCLTKTSNTFTQNAGIFGKVYFPRLTFPISIVFSNLLKLFIQLILFGVITYYFVFFEDLSINPNWSLVLLPVYIIILATLGLGVGVIFSSLTTKYRDLSFLLSFGTQLLMYATPIIYPLNLTSGKMKYLVETNPLTPILEGIRYAFFSIGQFNWSGILYSSTIALILVFLGILIFNKVEKNFMDTV